ncbi:hypothetical protein [Ralstonia mannitolilytica]|jgi:hypothetical protein|nr:hypothetical protein [Ralstonia mannitolilytica]MBY4717262.1 hypothetical protein [Ralstonia mannitolilytica]
MTLKRERNNEMAKLQNWDQEADRTDRAVWRATGGAIACVARTRRFEA